MHCGDSLSKIPFFQDLRWNKPSQPKMGTFIHTLSLKSFPDLCIVLDFIMRETIKDNSKMLPKIPRNRQQSKTFDDCDFLNDFFWNLNVNYPKHILNWRSIHMLFDLFTQLCQPEIKTKQHIRVSSWLNIQIFNLKWYVLIDAPLP